MKLSGYRGEVGEPGSYSSVGDGRRIVSEGAAP